jgi:hypothetical protein
MGRARTLAGKWARPLLKPPTARDDIARGVDPASRRIAGIAWALVACPLVAWFAALSADRATHGRLGAWAAPILLVLPAALAGAVNLALGRRRRFALAAALLAALVSAAGFAAFVIYFFLTVPDEFFN